MGQAEQNLRGKVSLQKSRTFSPRIRAIGQKRTFGGDLYHHVISRGWLALTGIVFGVFLCTNLLFCLAYLLVPGSISGAREGSFSDAFFFSVQTIATIGYGQMAPANLYGHILVTIEAFIGVVGFALVAGITFAKFSRPTAKVLFGNHAIIAMRNGVPHQSIHARYSYKVEDIIVGVTFADVLSTLPSGVRVVDYRHFHSVVPQATAAVARAEA